MKIKESTNIGHSNIQINRIGLGCMCMSEFYGSFNEIVTIPGTRRIPRLKENLGAYDVELTKEDLDLIDSSVPSETIGNRY